MATKLLLTLIQPVLHISSHLIIAAAPCVNFCYYAYVAVGKQPYGGCVPEAACPRLQNKKAAETQAQVCWHHTQPSDALPYAAYLGGV